MPDRVPGMVLPTIEERLELAHRLAPHDAERCAGLLATGLIDVALGGRDVAMVWPADPARNLTARQLAARARHWNES